ncbi:MAG: ATP-dependent sacrificial sulfur transferase LarE [Fibrobacterota bacterium]|nr:ATP-dependent sacrificial sulfur transferase LarE [Fibrobacterota bacterium]
MASPLDFSETRIDNEALLGKYRALKDRLRGLGEVLIGFSGGVDSTLLTAMARHVLGRDKVKACLALGPSLAEQERRDAVDLAALMDVELKTYPATEFDNPAYVANGPDRCFHCKADLFLHLGRFAAMARETCEGRIDVSPGSVSPGSGSPAILYGGNLDDTQDYRPGRKAAEVHGALAPLAEAGLGKAEVRALSRAIGLPTAEKAAQPCLSSRIPYGSPVTTAKLAAVESGEALLAAMGFREFRLRHFGDTARIEVPRDQLGLFSADAVVDLTVRLQALGFLKLEIDPAGFKSGRLNEVLSPESLGRFTDRPFRE